MLASVLEETHGSVELPDEKPGTFHDYLKCLKYGPDMVKVKVEKGKEGGMDVFSGLVEIWVLAEKIEDLRTANEVVDEIQRRHGISGRFPGAQSVNVAFAETTTYSPLRRLLEDYFVLEAGPADYEALRAEGVTGEFWFALSNKMRGLVEQVGWGLATFKDSFAKRVEQRPRCDYHLFDSRGCASCGRMGKR